MKSNLLIQGIGWFLLTAACVLLVLGCLKAALKRTGWQRKRQQKILLSAAIIISVWAALLLVPSYKGFFADFSNLPPRPALAILIPLPFLLMVAFSRKGTQLLQSVPQHWLVSIQSFRIIVELFLFFACITGKIPVHMTFEGRNFDVMTGLLAMPVGYMLATRKTYALKLAIVFNIIGLLLLINILVIAVLSMPTSIRYFMNEPANTMVAEFPFILLPGILVPLAYGLHILSLRQLLHRQKLQRDSAKERLATNMHELLS